MSTIDRIVYGVGKLILHVIGAVAEFERDLIRERTKAGIVLLHERTGARSQPWSEGWRSRFLDFSVGRL